MELKISDYQFGERPEVTRPKPEVLTILGESGIRKLVDDHYNLLKNSDYSPLFPQEEEETSKLSVIKQRIKAADDLFSTAVSATC
nr:hypothetical protein [uncultured Marinifilum sp.]